MPLSSQLRLLWRRAAATPGLTLLSLLTLAVAVGATVAIFTVVNAVLLRPLPFPESERLVLLRHAAPQLGPLNNLPMSDALHFLYAEQSRTLDGVVGFSDVAVSFTDPDNPQRVVGGERHRLVLRCAADAAAPRPPVHGRGGPAGRRTGGRARRRVVEEPVRRGFRRRGPGRGGRSRERRDRGGDAAGLRVSAAGDRTLATDGPRPGERTAGLLRVERRGAHGGRRVAGAGAGRASAPLLSNLEELLPDQPAAPIMAREYRPLIVPVREWTVGDVEATLWILLGAVGFLLLIACANVANLFLVRAEARHGEVAIRSALGASRARLVASVLLESLALGVAGGLAALLLALGAVRLLVRFGPRELPRLEEVSIDTGVLLFGLAVSLAAGLLFGLLPAWRASAVAASGPMSAGARGATSGRDRQLVRRGLVVVQIALALTLLVGSGLAVRSFQRLAAVDPGFDPVDVLTFALALPARDYGTPDSRLDFYRQMVDRLRALPGAVDAAASSTLPLDGVLNSGSHRIEGRPLAEGEVSPMFAVRVVSPGYFDAMRIQLVAGRVFDRLDEERGAPVVIVSRSLWPMRYVVRAPNAAARAGPVREALRRLDPALPVFGVETFETRVGRARGTRAFVMVLLVVAAGLALLLGAVGLYGVVSYTVAQRRCEIAIRMVVGARAGDVRRLVLAEAGGLALVGAMPGVGAALALTGQLRAILFETSPLDPAVFLGVSVSLVSVCLLASWVPARRATRVEPVVALRVE